MLSSIKKLKDLRIKFFIGYLNFKIYSLEVNRTGIKINADLYLLHNQSFESYDKVDQGIFIFSSKLEE